MPVRTRTITTSTSLHLSFHARFHLLQILRSSGKSRSLAHLVVVNGFEGNPTNLRGLCIGADASIWFFHAAVTYGREGENPGFQTLFFRCSRLMSEPLSPAFHLRRPKAPKSKSQARERISRENPGLSITRYYRSVWL